MAVLLGQHFAIPSRRSAPGKRIWRYKKLKIYKLIQWLIQSFVAHAHDILFFFVKTLKKCWIIWKVNEYDLITLIAVNNSSIIMFCFTTVIKSLFQGSSSQLMEESNDSKLGELVNPPFLLLSSKKEEAKPAGYWKRVCKRINTVFFIFYIIAASVFLVYMAACWNEE